jgi:hypothetical protein
MGLVSAQDNLLEMISKTRTSITVLTLSLLVLFCWPTLAQRRASITRDRPFEPAEELTYKAEFSRLLLRKLDVANFKLTVSQVPTVGEQKIGPESTYRLKLTGDVESQGFFARLFGISFRQRVESTVEPGSFVVQKTIRLDEQGKRVRSSEAIFDHERGQVTWIERDPKDPSRPHRTISSKFGEPVQDILSAIYFLRTRELQLGKKFDVPISDSGRVYQVPIVVTEKKRMKTSLGRLPVVRIEPQLFGPGGMIEEEGTFSIWLTDDNRRIPVRARLKTQYGTFDITLKKVSQPNAQLVSAQP